MSAKSKFDPFAIRRELSHIIAGLEGMLGGASWWVAPELRRALWDCRQTQLRIEALIESGQYNEDNP